MQAYKKVKDNGNDKPLFKKLTYNDQESLKF